MNNLFCSIVSFAVTSGVFLYVHCSLCVFVPQPERIDPSASRQGYDVRSDVWSLGITLVRRMICHVIVCVCGTESDFCYTAVSVWTGHGTVPLPEVEQCVRSADAGGEGRPATAQQLRGETVLPQIHQLRQPVVRHTHTHTWPRSHCDLQRFLFLRVCWLSRGDVITQSHYVITWCTRRLLLLIHSNCKSLWLTWFWRVLIKSFLLFFFLFLTALQRTIQKGQSTKSFWWVPVSCWKPRSTLSDMEVEWELLLL